MQKSRFRVAVLGKRNHLFWGEHVRDAFVENGHAAIFEPINVRPWRAQLARGVYKLAMSRDDAQERGDEITARIVARRLAAFRPDMVFFVGAFFVRLPFYRMAAALNPRPIVAGWDGDNHAFTYQNSEFADYLDVLFESDKKTTQEVAGGYKRVLHLSFAANPNIHRNYNQPRKAALYFCGIHTKERETLLAAAKDVPLTAQGKGWKRAALPAFVDAQDGMVLPKDWIAAYNKHRAAINSHQAHNGTSALNMRVFEIPACGALQVCDARDELPEMLVTEGEGAEVVVYKSPEEFRELAKRAAQDGQWAAGIAKRGCARVLAEHTYSERMKAVCALVK